MPAFHVCALTILLAQIVLIVIGSRLLGSVFRRIGQPLVMAEVVAGILLGPSLFGAVWPEAMAAVFPRTSMPVLAMLSQVGLVLFMFLVGLELDPKLLRGRTHSSVLISHTSIVVPFGLGAGAAFWLHHNYSSPDVPFPPFALFPGMSVALPAFPLPPRLPSRPPLMTSQVGAIAIACAAVDDVTAWCLLAFVVGVARAAALTEALWTTVLALAFVSLMVFVVRPLLRRVAERMVTREGLTANVVAIVFLVLCFSAGLTELIGIHALFGAFLFGAILPKEGRLAELLIEKLESVAVVMLLPLFFAFSGLRTQIGLVDSASDWLVTLALIGLASLGKFGGSTIAARITGIRWREASAIGVLMNTRGLMELIVLNIGLDLGVISPTVFTMLVIMALVTTFATTPILRWVYPDSELMKTRVVVGSTGEVKPAEPFTVLMCVDSDAAGPALATAAAGLVGTDRDARVIALHLTVPTDRPSVARRRRETAEQVGPLVQTMARAKSLQLEASALEFVSSDAGVDICRTADAKQASLVLLGWHKPVLLEGSLGGTVKKVLGRTSKPVAVLFDAGLSRLERVLVVSDQRSGEVVQLARGFASRAKVETVAAGTGTLAASAKGVDLVVAGMTTRGLDAQFQALVESGVSVLAVRAASDSEGA